MNHIMLRAEFPGADEQHIDEIHNWLDRRNWVRLTTPDEQVGIWHGTFDRQRREQDCHQSAIDAFIEASKQFCQVQLDILWAAKKPSPQVATLIG
ncbi:hypothetical protein [Mucilaginibacter myungsuensis]|uniref:Uncharacterized protein n=1 Tax=Mucilaginibacter myungsuensis TaxID=649104 RepID=A0A929PYL4_9SPHI|nr:hypothetical protein [Mucilaginibacter myungsuensis]MBE9663575.1 hypothetical protein [Mucilaginibacter myungsuensis]MDN3599101.1 hypothetical protein [Mucilaginibacter myungsuensis]